MRSIPIITFSTTIQEAIIYTRCLPLSFNSGLGLQDVGPLKKFIYILRDDKTSSRKKYIFLADILIVLNLRVIKFPINNF